MLFALEWIREQLAAVSGFFTGILETLTPDSIGAFLARPPALAVLYIAVALALACFGFRLHRLVSGLTGAAVMGVLGWGLGAAINPEVLSSSIVWALVFAIVGLFLFYILFIANAFAGAFIAAFALCGALYAPGIATRAIIAAAFALVYCFVLAKWHFIRTSIEGGALLGLIAVHYFGYYAALGVFAAALPAGILLQNALRKGYEAKISAYAHYKPEAPRPPTPEEIAAELAEEARERAERAYAAAIAASPEAEPEGLPVYGQLPQDEPGGGLFETWEAPTDRFEWEPLVFPQKPFEPVFNQNRTKNLAHRLELDDLWSFTVKLNRLECTLLQPAKTLLDSKPCV